jgi:3-hydroxyethyl bacteriochlorophyllide a dehydrogenase
LHTRALVLNAPFDLAVMRLAVTEPADSDVVIDTLWSGVSTGTERLLYSGKMPAFPGMGYPLVPGYEGVGRVRSAGDKAGVDVGAMVFVPGANCYGAVRGLFGANASTVVLPGARVVPISESLGAQGALMALAATAQHALAAPNALPDLIIGHGVVGRLLARLTVLHGGAAPTVWETNPVRASGAAGYPVVHPRDDDRRDYRAIYDASGDAALLDTLMGRLAPGGEIVLAGFYHERMSFAFPPAFMKEARLRVAAQFTKADLQVVGALMEDGRLDLSGLITNTAGADAAPDAYRTAFEDAHCLKMILDWRGHA